MRLIDADETIREIVWNSLSESGDAIEATAKAIHCIENMPSIERKKGKWIYPTEVIGFCRCGNCNALWDKSLYDNRFFRYCPRCGADMRGEQDE